MELITKDTTIGEIIKDHYDLVPVFMRNGLHCVGCSVSKMETIYEACDMHGINSDKLIDELNSVLNQNENYKKHNYNIKFTQNAKIKLGKEMQDNNNDCVSIRIIGSKIGRELKFDTVKRTEKDEIDIIDDVPILADEMVKKILENNQVDYNEKGFSFRNMDNFENYNQY